MDELLLADEGAVAAPPEALPTCLLTDFAVYDSEGFLKTLELVPLWSGVQPDVELYATGAVTQLPDGCDGYDEAAALAAGGGGSSGASSAPLVALSAIQEWHLEACADGRVDVVLRTDVAWYRLVTPTAAYAPYLDVVKKAGAVALALWRFVSADGARAARVTFDAAVDALAALPTSDPAFVSDSKPAVARFLAVHGQILLSQFKAIEQSAGARGLTKTALASALLTRLAARRHTVLAAGKATARAKAAPSKRLRANPLKDRATGRKAAPMTATATAMVRAVWRSYFKNPHGVGDAAPNAAVDDADVNEDDGEDDATEDALAAVAAPKPKTKKKKKVGAAAKLVGAPTSTSAGVSLYASAALGGASIAPGDVIELAPWSAGPVDADGDAVPALGVVQCFYTRGGASAPPTVQVSLTVRGADTVLGDAASDGELFVTTRVVSRPLADVTEKLTASRRVRAFSTADRRAHLAEDLALAQANADAADAGKPLTYFYRSFYEPERGMLRVLPKDLALGSLADENAGPDTGVRAGQAAGTFIKDGITIGVGDAVFLPPDAFDEGKAAAAPKKKKKRADSDDEDDDEEDAAANVAPKAPAPKGSRSKYHKGGANLGLRAWELGLVTGVAKGGASVTVQRFARPEDVSTDLAYTADWWDVYATTATATFPTASVIRRASIVRPDGGVRGGDDVFVCRGSVASLKQGEGGGAVTATVPPSVPATPPGGDTRPAPLPPRPACKADGDGVSLATMDIFAGCGGLSEGLHIAGASHAKWAIEYEPPAAEAYKLNNPAATVFADNCNVILAAAMKKAGCEGDCEMDEACAKEVDDLIKNDRPKYDALPAPGDVEFLCGGPPCQGYSGMNRFNKGNWSVVQNSMVMAYLSFADFYRPRYFLLENVRNFVSHNKSFTFRLTLRSLLDMGYSLRFGVLNAGNFGVAQSRKRAFIIAAAPGEALPAWPAPVHVFKSPQLTINLPGGVAYTAVPQVGGAPVRTVTVRDAIGDLPPIGNGEGDDERAYSGPPQSAFQRGIRGENAVLYDHISKASVLGGGRGWF